MRDFGLVIVFHTPAALYCLSAYSNIFLILYYSKCMNLFSLRVPPLLLSAELLHFLVAPPLLPLMLFPQLALSLLLLWGRNGSTRSFRITTQWLLCFLFFFVFFTQTITTFLSRMQTYSVHSHSRKQTHAHRATGTHLAPSCGVMLVESSHGA